MTKQKSYLAVGDVFVPRNNRIAIVRKWNNEPLRGYPAHSYHARGPTATYHPSAEYRRFDELETSEFLVIHTERSGGGGRTGDSFPDGHLVVAKMLKDGKYWKNGQEFQFYQSGCFECQIDTPVKVIRRIEKKTTVEWISE